VSGHGRETGAAARPPSTGGGAQAFHKGRISSAATTHPILDREDSCPRAAHEVLATARWRPNSPKVGLYPIETRVARA
jgi:hypothetical protein